MDPLKAENIRGNWATLLLPVNDDDSIDLRRLEAEIDTLISMGVHGIYSNGTPAEVLALKPNLHSKYDTF